jgi:hypothetical protein
MNKETKRQRQPNNPRFSSGRQPVRKPTGKVDLHHQVPDFLMRGVEEF